MAVELHEHQKKAVKALGNGKILVGKVGTGKSLTAAAYYVENEAPRDVYVITTAKKRDSLDWEDEFVHFGVGTERDATVHGVLTVDSWNNLKRYLDVKDAFFIFDEQRVVGSGSWSKHFIKIAKRNRWVLLSATPGDTWLDYIPVFVANGFYKNRTEFKRDHCVYSYYGKFPKLERYTGVGKLVRLRNLLLVDMPYERHTTRHVTTVTVDYNREDLERVTKHRWHIYKERPLKDIGEMFAVARKVVNSDQSRLSAVRSLMEKHPRLIVFYNFDYELEQLRTLANDPRLTEAGSSKPPSPLPSSSDSTATTSILVEAPAQQQSSGQSWSAEDSLGSTSSEKTEPGSQPRRDGLTNPSCSTPEHLSDPWNTGGARYRTTTSASTSPRQLSPASSSDGTGTTPTPANGSDQTPSPSRRSHESSSSSSSEPNSSTSNGSGSADSSTREKPEAWVNSESNGVETTTPPRDSSSATTNGQPSKNFVLAEWNGHKHQEVPTTDRWVYLVQYVAGSEGWNCTSTDAMVMYSLTYSFKNWDQAFGRIDRLNTPFSDLHYYVLQSKAWIDSAVRKSLNAKKSFNESAFGQKF